MEKTTHPLIYTSIPKVIGSVQAVSKAHTNTGQNYKFRSIDDVYNAINKALAEHKVSISCKYTVIENEIKSKISKNQYGEKETLTRQVVIQGDYKVYAEDGSYIEASSIGEANDTSDKAFNKAMSASYKYFMFQTFVIPTEEQKDTEHSTPELIPKAIAKKRDFNVEKFISNIEKCENIAQLNNLKDVFKTATDIDGKMGLTDEDIANIYAKLATKLKEIKATEVATKDDITELFETEN